MALQLMSIAALMATSANIYSKRSKLLGLDEYENGVSHKINMVKKKFGSLEQRLSHSVDDAVQKPFGAIYYNNKVVLYDPDTNILEIRMTMGTKTETAYSGFHVVRLAVYAPKGKLYNSLKDLYKGEIASKKDKRRGGPGVDTQGDMKRLRNSMKGQEIDKGNLPGGPNAERYEIDYLEDTKLTGWIIPVANTDQPSFGQSFGESEKVFYLQEGITLNSLVRVFCSCSDYTYTISPYNYQHGVHLGPKPTFPVPPSRKPTRNQTKQPGLCKHLAMMIVLLLNGGILQGSNMSAINNWRDLIVNREEHLVMPQKLTDENELRRLFSGVNDTIRKTEYDRKSEAQLRQDFAIFKKVEMAKNARELRAGTRTDAIGKGVSYAAMRDHGVTRADMYNKQMNELATRKDATARAIDRQRKSDMQNADRRTYAQRVNEVTQNAIRALMNRHRRGS